MRRLFQRTAKPVAQPPGTVEFTGPQRVESVRVQVIDFNQHGITEVDVADIAECSGYRESPTVTWINVIGLHDTGLIRDLGARFGVHSLALEDIVSIHQRPKFEDFDDNLFLVGRMLRLEGTAKDVVSEQLSLVVGHGYVISFQERPGDVFDPVRERLRRGRGRIRTRGADYLAYCLLDTLIDHYLLVTEAFGEAVEDLEVRLLDAQSDDPLATIHHLKRELIDLRRTAWPLRDVVTGLLRSESTLIDNDTVPFLRDASDHISHVGEAIEMFREMLNSLQDLSMANASNRLNDVMKVLTIFASIFVPLTFVAGIYGMNFENMPELGWRWSYPFFWGVIVVAASGMLVYFRRKRWL